MTSTRPLVVHRTGSRPVRFIATVVILVAIIGCEQRSTPEVEHPTKGPVELAEPRPLLPKWTRLTNATWAGQNSVAFTTFSGQVYRADLTTDALPTPLGFVGHTAIDNIAADLTGGIIAAIGVSGQFFVWRANGEVLHWGNLGLGGASAIAVDDTGKRLVLGLFSVDVFTIEPYRLISSGQQPQRQTMAAYSSLVFAGNRVAGWAGADNIDVWDVSDSTASLRRQDCSCEATRAVVDPAARLAVVATGTGHLSLWDLDKARTIADQVVITAPDQVVEPFAVVADRLVLFSLQSLNKNKQLQSGPLQAWDTATNTISTVWDCPECEVLRVVRRPMDNAILIYTGSDFGKYSPSLWTAALRR